MDQECINKWISMTQDKRVKWVCEQITSSFPYTYKGKRSITLFELIEKYNIPHIDVLAMDIEMSEYAVIQEYNWHIKPKYIVIEAHHSYFWRVGEKVEDLDMNNITEKTKRLIDNITTQGYELFNVAYDNPEPSHNIYRELDLHFLLK